MGVSTPTLLAHEVTQGRFYNFKAEPRPATISTDPAVATTTIDETVEDIPSRPSRDWGQTLQNVGSGLGALLSGFQTGQQSGGIFGGSTQSNQAFMMQQAEAERRRKRNTTIGIVVGVLAVGGIGYAIYKAK